MKLSIDFEEIVDSRKNYDGAYLLNEKSRRKTIAKKDYCINAEKKYGKKPVTSQLTELLARHTAKRECFKSVFLYNKESADYHITASLANFSAQQEVGHVSPNFPNGQYGYMTVGHQLELSQGYIIIELVNIEIKDKNNTIIATIKSFKREYNEKFPFKEFCNCIYSNMNDKLEEFNTELILEIEKKILETGVNP